MTDIDGNEYIDCVSSWGPLIFGHANEKVVEAISLLVKTEPPMVHQLKLKPWLPKITEMVPSIGKVRMVNSGTEATMSAIRLARGYTKKENNKICR